jgi:FkbM family methyltransferase
MSGLTTIARKLQGLENLAPPAWRLPLRYHGQRLVGGLEPEMALLKALVPPERISLDVGANHGVYAYVLSHLSRAVVCFEPLAECCNYILDYAAPNITVRNIALSDHAGDLELHVPIINGRAVHTRASLDKPPGAFESRRVGVRTLDSFELDDVGFIKIDVEGLEAAVLKGALHTLQKGRPAMLVEIDRVRHDQYSFMAVHSILQSLGYRALVCEAGQMVPCRDAWAASERHINFVFR